MNTSTTAAPTTMPSGPLASTADRSAHLRGMWAAVAPSWGAYADLTDARHTPDSTRMLEWTRPAPGERVLELACGAEGMALAAATLVGPTGRVTVSDVAVEMTEIAAARATALRVTNIEARVLDLGRIDQPDGSFDVVLCRDGLQFAPNPASAVSEIRRVLRPGGRAAVAVWGPTAANPWLSVVFDAVSAELGRPMPPPGVPGPFSLADAADVTALFLGAGLIDIVVDEVFVPLTAPSFDQWWTTTCALAGPLATVLDTLPPRPRTPFGDGPNERSRITGPAKVCNSPARRWSPRASARPDLCPLFLNRLWFDDTISATRSGSRIEQISSWSLRERRARIVGWRHQVWCRSARGGSARCGRKG